MTKIKAEFRKVDVDKIMKTIENMSEDNIKKIVMRAGRRAADAGRTETKRQISAETTLKPALIHEKVRPYHHDMAIGMLISDAARPLSDFAFTPKIPKRKANPVVEIYKGKKTVLSKGAFVQRMPKTGHIGIYERETDKALPIRQLAGPSITGLFKANDAINEKVQNRIFEIFETRVEHELNQILGIRNS